MAWRARPSSAVVPRFRPFASPSLWHVPRGRPATRRCCLANQRVRLGSRAACAWDRHGASNVSRRVSLARVWTCGHEQGYRISPFLKASSSETSARKLKGFGPQCLSVLLQRPRLLPVSQRRRPSVPHPAEGHAWTETRRSSLLRIQGLDLDASARSLLAPHRSTRSRETQETCRPRRGSLYGNPVHRAPLPATHAARDGGPPCPSDRPLCQQCCSRRRCAAAMPRARRKSTRPSLSPMHRCVSPCARLPAHELTAHPPPTNLQPLWGAGE